MIALLLAGSIAASVPAAVEATLQAPPAVPCICTQPPRGHRVEWTIEAIAGKGFDWLTTGIGIHAGASEGNSIVPTEEIRLGAGALAIAAQLLLVEVINKLFGDKAAVWTSRTITVGYFGLGLHNLAVANQEARR